MSALVTPTPREWDDRRHYAWADMLNACATAEPTVWTSRAQSKETEASKSWDLQLGFDGALALASGRTDWRTGRESIERIAREQAERFIAKRPFLDHGFDTTGEFFDIPSVLEGRPECWLRPMASNAGAPALVRLVVDLGTSGGVNARTMQERMCNVAAAALTLEACGNPIELIGCDSSQGRGGSYMFSYQITTAGEPIDVSRLAAVAHPGFFRRLVFRLIELTPSAAVHSAHQRGYGECPREIPDGVLAAEFGSHVVYVPPCPLYRESLPTAAKLLQIVKQRVGIVGLDDFDGDAFAEEGE